MKRLVDLINSVLKKRLFNGQKSRENLIVHVDNDVQISSLTSVNVYLLVKNGSLLGDLVVEKLKILDLTEESDEDRVEVNSEEALGSNWSLFSNQEILVEFLFSGLFNTSFPLLNLLVFELSQVLAKRGIKLLDILILFTILNGLRELGKTLHWLLNSLIETVSPVESTRDRWQVVGNRSSFVDSIYEAAALKEDLLDSLEILLIEL